MSKVAQLYSSESQRSLQAAGKQLVTSVPCPFTRGRGMWYPCVLGSSNITCYRALYLISQVRTCGPDPGG